MEKQKIEKILESTNQVARIGAWELDLETKEYTLSHVARDIFKIPKDYVVKENTILNYIKAGNSLNKLKAAMVQLVKTGQDFDLEVEACTFENDEIWVRDIGQAEFVNGKCIRLFGIFQDMTSIKQTEGELIRRNELLNFAEEMTMIGYWRWDFVENSVQWSTNLYHIFGLDETQTRLTYETYFSFVHPEDKERVTGYVQKSITEKQFHKDFIHRIVSSNGQVKTIQLLGRVLVNDAGEVVELFGTCQDMTSIKQTEGELIRRNELLNFAEEMTMIGYWRWDFVENSVQWSTNLYHIFGLDETQTRLTYETYFSFVHPEDKERVTGYVQKSITEKQFHKDFIHRIVSSNGQVKTIQLLGRVIVNDAGEVVELFGTCQDITEQRMAEIKFKGLLESAPDAMIIVNEKDEIQLINKQAERLFGYSAEELLGKLTEILVPKRFHKLYKWHRDVFFEKTKLGPVFETKDLYGKSKSNREFPIQISLSPLQTEEGLLVSVAIRDVTKQKNAQSRIIKSKESLELVAKRLTKQNRQLKDFAQITSHNLRAPVSNLNSLIDLYNILESEEDRKEVFSKFEKVTSHLTYTLNTLVEALKTKNDKAKNEDVYFENALNKTKEVLSSQIKENQVVIESDFSKIGKISYNKMYLESIFLNLVENAIKYRSPERPPKIFVESELNNGKIRLIVKDNGLGIDLQKHGHKLFGLNKVFHRHPDAKGVGLFMTKVQIENMGGSISASSQVGEGTTFFVNFN